MGDSSRTRWGWTAACCGLGVVLAAASGVHGQCQYDVTIIQAPECPIFGFPPTAGLGMNELGHVVGTHLDCDFIHDEAFVWTPESGLVTLSFEPGTIRRRAYDINHDGQIVGRHDVLGDGLGDLGFLYEDETVINLGTLPGGNFSEALAINERGQITGYWGSPTGPDHGFIWQDDVMMDLGPTMGAIFSRAYDINDAGQVTGWRREEKGGERLAFLWEDGLVTDLGPIPGGFTSEARGINNLGEVVGLGWLEDPKTGDSVRHGFFWSGGQMIDLGTLPGMPQSLATDLNDAGQVVGSSFAQGGRAFIWQAGRMIDLNDLISPDVGVTIGGAYAISDTGQIVGTGEYPGGNIAILLTPLQQPLGDLNHDCRVGIADLLMLLASWGPCDQCAADLNGDGFVGVGDLLILFANWG